MDLNVTVNVKSNVFDFLCNQPSFFLGPLDILMHWLFETYLVVEQISEFERNLPTEEAEEFEGCVQ